MKKRQVNTTKILTHIGVWIVLIVLRMSAISANDTFFENLIVSIVLYACYAFIFYLSENLQKHYQEQKSILTYIIGLSTIFIVGIVLFRISFSLLDLFVDLSLPLGVKEGGFVRTLFFILAGTMFQTAKRNQIAEKQRDIALAEKTTVELNLLKNQMNPHFFFNTLNNIYGLAYSKDDKAPQAISKLSEAMRYIIYDTKEELVLLSKELDFTKNYIELERLRLVNPDKVSFEIGDNINHYKIAPLIFLPFVENCFKHSDIAHNKNANIEINIWIENNLLNYSGKNTFNSNQQVKTGGTGLESAKKRLNAVYAENYKLEINTEDSMYYVFLSLPLN